MNPPTIDQLLRWRAKAYRVRAEERLRGELFRMPVLNYMIAMYEDELKQRGWTDDDLRSVDTADG